MLFAAGLWLSRGYFQSRLIGTPDALWYHNLLADAVTQFRLGVFPVYVGQTDYSFNGAVYPIRAAPYFQYLAGFLDLVTAHSLSFFGIQHLTVTVSFVSGIFAAYGSLIWVAPGRRWTAFALSFLYVLCPGVAGLFYAQDLYMSGMAIPWVPLAFAALVKSFDDRRLLPRAVLATALAALWWAHSPIALWTTFFATTAQIIRMAIERPNQPDLSRAFGSALIFCALAAYPIISVFVLRTHGESIVPYTMDRELLLRWVRGSFPSSLEPIDAGLPGLSHLQLGYALWTVFILCIAVYRQHIRLWAVGTLLASAIFMTLLVFPVPGITRALWLGFPETVVGMTLYWPMQRFYILIAAAIIVSAQRILGDVDSEGGLSRPMLFVGLLAGILWSVHEDSKLIRKALEQGGTVEASRDLALTENVAVQRHTYGLFPRRPIYFSHGVVDPNMESHLLDSFDGRVIASDYDLAKAAVPRLNFQGRGDNNPGILDLDPPITLQPGKRYLLNFDFAHKNTIGVLQMTGDHFYREYSLPQSGESKAFGSGPENEKSVTVWTSLSTPETIRLRFIPTAENAKPADYMPFAKFELQPIDLVSLPIQVDSLIPFRAAVRSPRAAVLETPRMFVPGYAAFVDGLPVDVRKSAEGLVAFPVPVGKSKVELRFIGPLALRAAFWLSATGWLLLFIWLFIRLKTFCR